MTLRKKLISLFYFCSFSNLPWIGSFLPAWGRNSLEKGKYRLLSDQCSMQAINGGGWSNLTMEGHSKCMMKSWGSVAGVFCKRVDSSWSLSWVKGDLSFAGFFWFFFSRWGSLSRKKEGVFFWALLVSSCSLRQSLVFLSLVASFFWSFNTHTSLPHGMRGTDSLLQGCLVGFFLSHHGSQGALHVTCWLVIWREFSCAGFCGRLVQTASSRFWRWWVQGAARTAVRQIFFVWRWARS